MSKDIIKDLKKMGLVPKTKHYNQMMKMTKWVFIIMFLMFAFSSLTGCSTIQVAKNGKLEEEFIRIFDEDDLIRDMEIKMRSLPNQGIEITEGFCWSERMGVHFCPDGRTY